MSEMKYPASNIGSLIQVRELCRKYNVKSLYLFGSAANGKNTPSSDIDLLVDFIDLSPIRYTDNYFGLYESLQQLFNENIDLVTNRSLQNPVLINEIEQSKKLIYVTRN